MALTKMGDFTFDHADQADTPALTPAQLKTGFDSRGEELKTVINALIDALEAVTDSASGADQVGMTAIAETGASATVQAVIEALITRLKATTDGASGADLIGATAIADLTGATVQTLLEFLAGKFNKTTGHGHTGADGDSPPIGATGIANNAVTDEKIGLRSVSGTIGNTGWSVGFVTLTGMLQDIYNRLIAITGVVPTANTPITLNTLLGKFHAFSGHKHTGATGDCPQVDTTGIADDAVTSDKIADSPTFTGTPAAPTASAGTNTTQIATTAFIKTAVTNHNTNLLHKQASSITQTGTLANAEGSNSVASGNYSHAEGYHSTASGIVSHAEGNNATANNSYSHAEGYSTTASGNTSHAEGSGTTASGDYSHAQGKNTTASAIYSHAEGGNAEASGNTSHAEGYGATASGDYSHAQNYFTIAQGSAQTAIGEYNVAQGSNGVRDDADYVFIIGNGTSDSERSNAASIDWAGNMTLAGDKLALSTPKTPASATATGVKGTICWDANYIYVCVATNTWKRTAISTW